jgi:hypothetical protein
VAADASLFSYTTHTLSLSLFPFPHSSLSMFDFEIKSAYLEDAREIKA